MTFESINEEQLSRVYEALARADREQAFQPDAALTGLIDELNDWLSDDRQWVSAHGSHWVSLLNDLTHAHAARGTAFQDHLRQPSWVWGELKSCRKALTQNPKKAPDPALRRRLQRVEQAISARLEDPEGLVAVWQDLLTTKTFTAAASESRWLFKLLVNQGRSAKNLINYLREIIADDLVAIRTARGEKWSQEDHRKEAGLTPSERSELVAQVLRKEARRGDMVVWLRYGLADIGPDQLRVGNVVTFYRQEWLAHRLENGPREELPPELHDSDRYSSVESLAGVNHFVDDDDDEEDDDDEQNPPYVVVRVALGDVKVAEAVELAQENAELIVSLSTLHGGDPSIWVLAQDFVCFRNDKPGGSSMHAPNVSGMTLDQRSAIYRDAMPEVFETWAEQLEPYMPLQRADLRRAAQLALWLRRARETWEPGRLVLCDRIFEQVAGWAGVVDRGEFIHDYLRLPWAMGRIRMEVRNCWSAIASESIFGRVVSEEAWKEIKQHPPLEYEPFGSGWRVNLRGVMNSLDFLLGWVDSQDPLYERISILKRRTSSGKALSDWVKELLQDFDALERRARRVRNSVIHGGPVSDVAARSVLVFIDWLAADALHASLQGILRDEDLIDRFLNRRWSYQESLEKLERNEPPGEVFFWGEE